MKAEAFILSVLCGALAITAGSAVADDFNNTEEELEEYRKGRIRAAMSQ